MRFIVPMSFVREDFSLGGCTDPECSQYCWEDEASSQIATIEPGALVWVRSRERVAMPPDMVGLWIQTNTLARKGLLLLNMSLVEPGYSGYLTAALVNFGRERVAMSSATKVAKLLFLRLDSAAQVRFKKSWSAAEYDQMLSGLAANSPRTFLQLEDAVPKVQAKMADALRQVDDAISHAKSQIDRTVEGSAKRVRTDLEKNIRSFVLKLAGGVILGLVLGLVVFYFLVDKVYFRLSQEYIVLDKKAEDIVTKHASRKVDRDDPNLLELRMRVETLEQLGRPSNRDAPLNQGEQARKPGNDRIGRPPVAPRPAER